MENPMERNPYEPPQAAVDDVSSTGLKRRSVILMIVFAVVTLGLYFAIWFLRRRAALNALDSPRKLRLWPFVIYIVWFVVQFVVGIIAGIIAPGQPFEQAFGEAAAVTIKLVQVPIGILMLVQNFRTKDILEDHLAGPGDQIPNPLFVETVKLSGAMTFFFQIFYLQYVINRHIVGPKSTAVQQRA